MKIQFAFIFVLFFFLCANAQTLDYETKTTIHLDDGSVVELYGKVEKSSALQGKHFNFFFKRMALPARNAEYYYVPPGRLCSFVQTRRWHT